MSAPGSQGLSSEASGAATSNETSLDDTKPRLNDHDGQEDLEAGQRGLFSTSTDGQGISLDDVNPAEVLIRQLSVSIDTAPSWLDPATYGELFASKLKTTPRPKQLLHSVSADLKPGTLTAIIGGSGSGKTTLLNTLAERVTSSRLSESGLITFNGNIGLQSARTAYVMQQDILIPTLTVRETLQYSADLRLPSTTTAEDRQKVVEEVILELGLKECADTRIGDSQHRGCSGGEKRRVSIGVQLLANPSVLFLDEPTTGLDATSALQVISTLNKLANKGRTIITTIHQPRSEIWTYLDNLIVLSRGSTVYSGQVSECLGWFEDQGFKLPPFVNPAEHIIDIAAVDNRTPELEEESTSRVDALTAAWNSHSRDLYRSVVAEDEHSTKMAKTRGAVVRSHAGFVRQTRVLTHRTFRVTVRDPMGMTASLLESVFMAVCLGYMFFNLSRDQAGIRSRQGGLYIAAGLQGYLVLLFEVYRLTTDVPTYDREFSDGCVYALPFNLSRRLARLLTEDIPVPFLFSAIFYFMAGFDRDVSKFFIFLAISILNQYIAVTCAMTCVATIRHFAGATLLANLVFTLQSLACGMFIQADSIPVYMRWLKWIAYNYYAFSAYAGNEFQGSFYDCPEAGGPSNPACKQYTGEFIMDSLGFPGNWVGRPIAVLVGFIGLFAVLSTIGLQYLKVEISVARARNSNNTDLSAGKEVMRANSISQQRTIHVGLENFGLDLDKRSMAGKKLPQKTILNPVTTEFEAGVLNVIMGPSGSGKTSLLNALALRLRNSASTRYKPRGRLLFNGAVPSDTVIRSVCSYVCQDDDALLPSLTVRETLHFSAGLRLPSHMSAEEKKARAEDILLKMGLKDCADNLVGNDLVKGISGGEKRRVSIAVQILTDPRVLLLDEPTSGLDAFTASSIMEVLRGLANEGRTLILTIHQARSDLFKHFGNVLLLARGGTPAFAGAASTMLGYFAAHGYMCPTHTNPADFALDLITIDLQQDQKELQSRERVQKFLDSWAQHSDAGHAPNEGGNTNEKQESAAISSSREKDDTQNSEPFRREPSQPKGSDKASVSMPAELGALVRKGAPFRIAFPLLLHRATINFRRQPPVIIARIAQVVSLAVVLALFFAPLYHNYYSVQTRMGLVQELGSFYFVGMLQNVAVYPIERDVFYREDDDGVYGVEAFLTTYTLLEVPCEILSSLLFGLLCVLAVELPRTATVYFASCFCCFAIVSVGESLGIMFNTLFGHTGFAVNLMGVFLALATAMGGVLSINMPALFRDFNYLSPIRYGMLAFAQYSLRGVEFWCEEDQKLPSGRCPIQTGEDVLELYHFEANPAVNIAGLAGSRLETIHLFISCFTRLSRLSGDNAAADMEVHRSDYAITKPSMSKLPHRRAKIIRTYGRQPSAGAESQGKPSAAKRRRIDPARALPTQAEPDQVQNSCVKASHESLKGRGSDASHDIGQKASKESILSFFKPVTKPSGPQVDESQSSTPSPQKQEPRSRLLRLRFEASPARKSAKRRHNKHKNPGADAEPGTETSGGDASAQSNPLEQRRRVLSDKGDALHNQQRRKTDMDAEEHSLIRVTSKPTVQTTLNISCQAAFSECKTCNTVWNPLYPDDVQVHKNRHAAFLREQRKRKRAEF